MAKKYRGQDLSNQLTATLIKEAQKEEIPIVMRTNWQSPMMAVAEKFGMQQIMGPQAEIDRVAKEIKLTGTIVNNIVDSEIEDRVLFILG